MFRGEFIRDDGLVVPNNITRLGAKEILTRALSDSVQMNFHVALVKGVYTPALRIEDMIEPTIGVNGYARIDLLRNNTDWPVVGMVNDEWYMETRDLVWVATGGDFDQAITRLAIVDGAAGGGDVFALSGSLPAEIILTPTTPVEQRTFRYRLYLR